LSINDTEVESSRTGLEIDTRSTVGRSGCRHPDARRHSDYEKPRWATCHIECVDKVFATPTGTHTDASRNPPKVRLDLDGLGEGSGSLTDRNENVNLSVWFTPEMLDDLIQQLVQARKKGIREHWSREEEEDQ